MRISTPALILVAVFVIGGIIMHQRSLHQHNQPERATSTAPQPAPGVPAAVVANHVPAPDLQPPPPPGGIIATSPPAEAIRIEYRDSLYWRQRRMDEQVQRMRIYARNADPDDPFALTPDAIEAFRQQGDPMVW